MGSYFTNLVEQHYRIQRFGKTCTKAHIICMRDIGIMDIVSVYFIWQLISFVTISWGYSFENQRTYNNKRETGYITEFANQPERSRISSFGKDGGDENFPLQVDMSYHKTDARLQEEEESSFKHVFDLEQHIKHSEETEGYPNNIDVSEEGNDYFEYLQARTESDVEFSSLEFDDFVRSVLKFSQAGFLTIREARHQKVFEYTRQIVENHVDKALYIESGKTQYSTLTDDANRLRKGTRDYDYVKGRKWHRQVYFPESVRMKRSSKRAKRRSPPITIELFMVVDYAAYEWWDTLSVDLEIDNTLDLIHEYYGYISRGIDSRFKSIDTQSFQINVELVGIHVAQTEDDSYWTLTSILEGDGSSHRQMVNSSEALEKFQTWLDINETHFPHFDHAILFTGTNLTYAGNSGNTGLAFGSSMCLNISNSSIVEDLFDFRTITFATQQLARSLGSNDDMDNNDCLEFFNYIMAPKFKLPVRSFASNRWKFSSCSQQYIKEYLDGLNTNDLNCLQDKHVNNNGQEKLIDLKQELLGFIYSAKQQCQHRFGSVSDICRIRIGSGYSKLCSGLLCSVAYQDTCEYILPADGTSCGNRKYCWEGTCQEFEGAKVASDTCVFGNDPNMDCDDLVNTQPFVCYKETVRYACCESCESVAVEMPGCEYGDRSDNCSLSGCIRGDKMYITNECCLTCANGPTPYASSVDDFLSGPATPSQSVNTSTLASTRSFSLPMTVTSQSTTVTDNHLISVGGNVGSVPNNHSGEQILMSDILLTTTSSPKHETVYSREATTPITTSQSSGLESLLASETTESIPTIIPTTISYSSVYVNNTTSQEFIVDVPSGKTEATKCACNTTASLIPELNTSTLRPNNIHPSDQEFGRLLTKDINKSMRISQRHIRDQVYADLNALFTSISGRLGRHHSDNEHEYEAYREGSEIVSSDDEDINRTLRPIWLKHYRQLMTNLNMNVKDMRYKVISTLYRHYKLP